MAEINTIIQLRNDTAEKWATEAGQATPLKPGEVAVEIVDGKAKLKIGTSNDSTFGNSEYFGSDVKEAQVYQSEILKSTDEQDDIAVIESLIPEGVEVQNGDIAIVKRYITGESGAVSYTSYVYDSSYADEASGNPGWEATDGNYSASNVFLKNKITLTSALGNYTNGHTINAGTSLETVLSGLMQKEKEPSPPTKPSASISVSGGSAEAGTEYTVPTAKLSIGGVGSYTYGPATGIVFNIGDIKLAEGADPATATNYTTNTSKVTGKSDNLLSLKATGDKKYYTDGDTNYTFSGSASYQAATAGPETNLGNPSKTQTAIAAGSCSITDQTATFTGYRKMFIGVVDADPAEVNSAFIRGLTTVSEKAAKTTKTFTANAGKKSFYIAIPTSLTTTAPTINYLFFGEWKSLSGVVALDGTINVAGATSNVDAKPYKVYKYTPESGSFSANTEIQVIIA